MKGWWEGGGGTWTSYKSEPDRRKWAKEARLATSEKREAILLCSHVSCNM